MKQSSGFTLIEVIVIITVMAVAAALFASYMGTAFTKSPASAAMVSKQYQLIQQMEIITNKYRQQLKEGTLNLCTDSETQTSFKTEVLSLGSVVDAANTYCQPYTLGTIEITDVLLVTLTDGQNPPQKLQSMFAN
jgi:type II secretory pathway pseudopilin PulG